MTQVGSLQVPRTFYLPKALEEPDSKRHFFLIKNKVDLNLFADWNLSLSQLKK